MPTTNEYNTSQECLTLLQEEVSDTTPDTNTQNRYLSLLNRAHKAILAGGGELNLDDKGNPIRRPFVFPWALAAQPKSLVLEPAQTGSIDITSNNASTLNCTIDAGTKSLVGWHIRFDQNPTVYKVLTHSGTTLGLDSVCVDDTTTQIAFTAFKLIYTLGSNDILLLTDKGRAYARENMESGLPVVDINELLSEFPLHRVIAKTPDKAAVIRQDNGTFTLQFSSYPDKLERFDFRYVPIPAALAIPGQDPLIPNASGQRAIISYLAAYYHLIKRDDDRAKAARANAEGIWNAMITEATNNVNSNDPDYGHISPWSGGYDGFDSFGGSIVEVVK